MAYMNKEMKASIVAEVKKVLPKNWKASFAIRNYSTIVMTISKATFDLSVFNKYDSYVEEHGYLSIHSAYLKSATKSDELNEIFAKIGVALNGLNHDNSDIMTDYFDVGYYVDFNVGSYKKPYEKI